MPQKTTRQIPAADLASLRATVCRTEDEAEVQRCAIDLIHADPQRIVDCYRQRFGNEFNPDNGAEMFPEYRASPEARRRFRVAISPAAGWVADQAFLQRIAELDRDPVVFTSGGTGSGKSTMAAGLQVAPVVVFDSTFSNYQLSKRRLLEALNSCRNVAVHYVYRDPVEAFAAAKNRALHEGQGRMVTVAAHAATHGGAAKTIAQLTLEFGEDPRVAFAYFASATATGFRTGTIDLASCGDYSGLRERLGE